MSLQISMKSRSFSSQQHISQKLRKYPVYKLPQFLVSQISTRQSFKQKQSRNLISFRRNSNSVDMRKLSHVIQQNHKIFRNSSGFQYPGQVSLKMKNARMNYLLSKSSKNEDWIQSKQKVILGRYCNNFSSAQKRFQNSQQRLKSRKGLLY